MKAMKMVVRTSTYPLHLDRLPRFIMFPVLRMCLLTQTQSHHAVQVPGNHTADGYADAWLSVLLRKMMMTLPTDEIPSPNNTLPVQYHTDILQWPSSKYTLNAYYSLEAEEEVEEEDFQTVPHDDEHWDMEEIPDRHLCIHEHSLPHGLCPYQCPYSDYQASSYYDTLDLSDISEFADQMTTSSNKDVPALNDIGY